MTVSIRIEVDADILDAYADLATVAPRAVRSTFANTVNFNADKALEFMRTEPDPPDRPIRWKTERQRRYVMWRLKLEADARYGTPDEISYKRTHEYRDSWSVKTETTELTGTVTLESSLFRAQFIGGVWQQPFLDKWNTDTEAYVVYSEKLQDDLIRQWFILNDTVIPMGGR